MITTIMQKLKSDFEAINEIEVVYDYPEEKPRGYPYIIFLPTSLSSAYHSQIENEKAFTFAVYINFETKELGEKKVWTELMPNAVQAVMDKIDAEWNGGVVDGARVWYTLETGDWSQIVDPKSKATQLMRAELSITIRYLKLI